jgi:RNase P/RNase MRP subunit p29
MPINADNIRAHELIGLELTIAIANDPTLKGLTGIIRDETRNTLQVEARGRLLRVPKAGTSFSLRLPTGDSLLVVGTQIMYRPEDRVKKGLARSSW